MYNIPTLLESSGLGVADHSNRCPGNLRLHDEPTCGGSLGTCNASVEVVDEASLQASLKEEALAVSSLD